MDATGCLFSPTNMSPQSKYTYDSGSVSAESRCRTSSGVCFNVSLCALGPVTPVGNREEIPPPFTGCFIVGACSRDGVIRAGLTGNDKAENTMTEGRRLKSGAEVAITEGRTEESGKKKRETCQTDGSQAATMVRRWITQQCSRSNNPLSSRCIGIIYPVCTCVRSVCVCGRGGVRL